MPRAPQAEDSGPGLCAQHAEQGILCVSEHMCVHTGDRLLLQGTPVPLEKRGGSVIADNSSGITFFVMIMNF